jgi:hypothetical protein
LFYEKFEKFAIDAIDGVGGFVGEWLSLGAEFFR